MDGWTDGYWIDANGINGFLKPSRPSSRTRRLCGLLVCYIYVAHSITTENTTPYVPLATYAYGVCTDYILHRYCLQHADATQTHDTHAKGRPQNASWPSPRCLRTRPSQARPAKPHLHHALMPSCPLFFFFFALYASSMRTKSRSHIVLPAAAAIPLIHQAPRPAGDWGYLIEWYMYTHVHTQHTLAQRLNFTGSEEKGRAEERHVQSSK